MIADALTECRNKLSAAVEAAAVGESILNVVRGLPVSDFDESYPVVREAVETLRDLREKVARYEHVIIDDSKKCAVALRANGAGCICQVCYTARRILAERRGR